MKTLDQLVEEKAEQYGQSAVGDVMRYREWLEAEGLPTDDETVAQFEEALIEELGEL